MNSIILTANQRLAFYLSQEKAVNPVFLKDWLTQIHQKLGLDPFLLSDTQELVLWEAIIAQTSSQTHPELVLLSSVGLSKTVQTAWHLLKHWNLPLSAIAHFPSTEVQIFYEWALEFEQRCKTLGCVDISTATDEIIKALEQRRLVLDQPVAFAGFERLYPQLERLQVYFLTLEEAYTALTRPTGTLSQGERGGAIRGVGWAKCNAAQQYSAENEEAEMYAMAQWAYQLHQAQPEAKIGCIVPKLNQVRHQVEYIFDQVFKGVGFRFHGNDEYNLSGGQRFSSLPLIQTAFDIFQLMTRTRFGMKIDVSRFSRVIKSPFLRGAEQEFITRAALDIQLKKTQEPFLYHQTLAVLIQTQADCPILCETFQPYFECSKSTPKRQSASEWAAYFSNILESVGWPGERTLNSSEYQQVKRWNELLEELSALDAVLSHALTKRQAVHQLQQLAQHIVFQPESKLASVQVLGLWEAIDMPFDAVWVCGMTQEDWPANTSPNPFIPVALQRKYQMPHSSAEWEMEYSQRLTAYFCEHVEQVIFSYTLQKEDRPQMPSGLILEFPFSSFCHPLQPSPCPSPRGRGPLTFPLSPLLGGEGGYKYIKSPSPQPSLSREREKTNAPPVSKEEVLLGGASILKHQAACPFKAFATVRLGAAKLPETQFYLTPAERGTHLHAALDKIWSKLKDQKTLLAYDESALEELLKPIVHRVLTHAAQKRPFTLRPNLLKLEEKRLVDRLKAWLAVEKTRPPFQVIASEIAQTVEFSGLPLKLRLDRKDRLENGDEVILDYKTGVCSSAQWLGDRPDEPQLLLYGLTSDQPISGLIFAQILADKLTFIGIGAEDYGISGVTTITSWQSFLTDRRDALTKLTKEFQSGYAAVDPKTPQTCFYCDLQPLCRIFEKKT